MNDIDQKISNLLEQLHGGIKKNKSLMIITRLGCNNGVLRCARGGSNFQFLGPHVAGGSIVAK